MNPNAQIFVPRSRQQSTEVYVQQQPVYYTTMAPPPQPTESYYYSPVMYNIPSPPPQSVCYQPAYCAPPQVNYQPSYVQTMPNHQVYQQPWHNPQQMEYADNYADFGDDESYGNCGDYRHNGNQGNYRYNRGNRQSRYYPKKHRGRRNYRSYSPRDRQQSAMSNPEEDHYQYGRGAAYPRSAKETTTTTYQNQYSNDTPFYSEEEELPREWNDDVDGYTHEDQPDDFDGPMLDCYENEPLGAKDTVVCPDDCKHEDCFFAEK